MDEHLEQSLNLAWVLLAAFLVMFMQAVCHGGDGLHPVQERRAHHGDELHHLSDGGLGFWMVGFGIMGAA